MRCDDGANRLRSLALGLCLVLGLTAAPSSAQAPHDPYRVERVPVDASADDAVTAREQALDNGQRDGLHMLMGRLTSARDAARLPDVRSLSLDRLVRSFDVADEQVGATRYVGHINVNYDGAEVERLLRDAGIAYAVGPFPAVVVVPALRSAEGYDLWSDNPWRAAWAARADQGQLLEMRVPLGDLGDLSGLPPDALAQQDASAMAALASRYDAASGYVVAATLPEELTAGAPVRLEVLGPDLQRVGAAEVATIGEGSEPTLQLEPVVAAAVRQVEEAWKADKLVRADQVAALPVEVALVDFPGWLQIRRHLEGIPWIRRLRIDELGRDHANLVIEYIGDFQQLDSAIADNGLRLAQENGTWRLLPAGGQRELTAPSVAPAPLP
jgi:hypothetical protein